MSPPIEATHERIVFGLSLSLRLKDQFKTSEFATLQDIVSRIVDLDMSPFVIAYQSACGSNFSVPQVLFRNEICFFPSYHHAARDIIVSYCDLLLVRSLDGVTNGLWADFNLNELGAKLRIEATFTVPLKSPAKSDSAYVNTDEEQPEGLRKMFENDYTPSDRAYNAFLRLAKHLFDMSSMLDECERIIEGKEPFDSLNGIDDIVQQLKQELDALERMAKDASERWKPIEAHVSKSVGRLKIETPEDSVTWSQFVLGKAWRAWNGMNAQLLIHEKNSRKVVEGMVSYRPKLGKYF